MASQQQDQIFQALRTAPQLRPFIIHNVKATGRLLGSGSYGTVEELEIGGLVCAGKKIYDALVDPEDKGAKHMVDKYYKECELLCKTRHPHIVQFLGICFLPDSRLPVLVMERLGTSLDELLESTADISLFTKLSVLHDVAKGLVYLHNHSPPIIHRDLTARNILLDSALTAKIADLGNSRLANIIPGRLDMSMSQGIPGTLMYMPPEVSDEKHRYGPPLDMFSFGHLALFTAIQTFPEDLLSPTYLDPRTNRKKHRSELERRGKYIVLLHEKFDKRHPLVVLIKACLEQKPGKRPSAMEALERLGKVRAETYDPFIGFNKLQLEASLMEREVQLQQIPLLKFELKQLKIQNKRMEEATRAKDELLAVRKTEIQQIPQLITELKQLNVR